MSIGDLLRGLFRVSSAPPPSAEDAQRLAVWGAALRSNTLPDFVDDRLKAAAAGRLPWLSTTTPAELKMIRDHGIRPVTMVSGTCWFHYGFSWTEGHREGWHDALRRMQSEAIAAGANAVVDVKLRTLRFPGESSMDFTVFGTAIKIDGLPPSSEPVIATVPALEFVRLLKAGIVPVGIAVGAHYEWLGPPLTVTSTRDMPAFYYNQRYSAGLPRSLRTPRTRPIPDLTDFWDSVRRVALHDLFRDAKTTGDGVLAHTHFGELLFDEGEPERFLGRVIVIGTVVHSRHSATNESPDIWPVVDMRDGESPLSARSAVERTAYMQGEGEGAI